METNHIIPPFSLDRRDSSIIKPTIGTLFELTNLMIDQYSLQVRLGQSRVSYTRAVSSATTSAHATDLTDTSSPPFLSTMFGCAVSQTTDSYYGTITAYTSTSVVTAQLYNAAGTAQTWAKDKNYSVYTPIGSSLTSGGILNGACETSSVTHITDTGIFSASMVGCVARNITKGSYGIITAWNSADDVTAPIYTSAGVASSWGEEDIYIISYPIMALHRFYGLNPATGVQIKEFYAASGTGLYYWDTAPTPDQWTAFTLPPNVTLQNSTMYPGRFRQLRDRTIYSNGYDPVLMIKKEDTQVYKAGIPDPDHYMMLNNCESLSVGSLAAGVWQIYSNATDANSYGMVIDEGMDRHTEGDKGINLYISESGKILSAVYQFASVQNLKWFYKKTSGTPQCDAGGTTSTLIDAATTFDASYVGLHAVNETDGSRAVVSKYIGAHTLYTSPLEGGVDNLWSTNGYFHIGDYSTDGDYIAFDIFRFTKIDIDQLYVEFSSVAPDGSGNFTKGFRFVVYQDSDYNVDTRQRTTLAEWANNPYGNQMFHCRFRKDWAYPITTATSGTATAGTGTDTLVASATTFSASMVGAFIERTTAGSTASGSVSEYVGTNSVKATIYDTDGVKVNWASGNTFKIYPQDSWETISYMKFHLMQNSESYAGAPAKITIDNIRLLKTPPRPAELKIQVATCDPVECWTGAWMAGDADWSVRDDYTHGIEGMGCKKISSLGAIYNWPGVRDLSKYGDDLNWEPSDIFVLNIASEGTILPSGWLVQVTLFDVDGYQATADFNWLDNIEHPDTRWVHMQEFKYLNVAGNAAIDSKTFKWAQVDRMRVIPWNLNLWAYIDDIRITKPLATKMINPFYDPLVTLISGVEQLLEQEYGENILADIAIDLLFSLVMGAMQWQGSGQGKYIPADFKHGRYPIGDYTVPCLYISADAGGAFQVTINRGDDMTEYEEETTPVAPSTGSQMQGLMNLDSFYKPRMATSNSSDDLYSGSVLGLGAPGATTLKDTNATFTRSMVGMQAWNESDYVLLGDGTKYYSRAIITTFTDANNLVTTSLTGGTDNLWTNGDSYKIKGRYPTFWGTEYIEIPASGNDEFEIWMSSKDWTCVSKIIFRFYCNANAYWENHQSGTADAGYGASSETLYDADGNFEILKYQFGRIKNTTPGKEAKGIIVFIDLDQKHLRATTENSTLFNTEFMTWTAGDTYEMEGWFNSEGIPVPSTDNYYEYIMDVTALTKAAETIKSMSKEMKKYPNTYAEFWESLKDMVRDLGIQSIDKNEETEWISVLYRWKRNEMVEHLRDESWPGWQNIAAHSITVVAGSKQAEVSFQDWKMIKKGAVSGEIMYKLKIEDETGYLGPASEASRKIGVSGTDVYLTDIYVPTDTRMVRKRLYRTDGTGEYRHLDTIPREQTFYYDMVPAAMLGSVIESDTFEPPRAKYIEKVDNRIAYLNVIDRNNRYRRSRCYLSQPFVPHMCSDEDVFDLLPEDGQELRGIAYHLGHYLVWKDKCFYSVDPNTFERTPRSNNLGLLAPETLKAVPEVGYAWLSHEGVCFGDHTDIDTDSSLEIWDDIKTILGTSAMDILRKARAEYYNKHYILWVGINNENCYACYMPWKKWFKIEGWSAYSTAVFMGEGDNYELYAGDRLGYVNRLFYGNTDNLANISSAIRTLDYDYQSPEINKYHYGTVLGAKNLVSGASNQASLIVTPYMNNAASTSYASQTLSSTNYLKYVYRGREKDIGNLLGIRIVGSGRYALRVISMFTESISQEPLGI